MVLLLLGPQSSVLSPLLHAAPPKSKPKAKAKADPPAKPAPPASSSEAPKRPSADSAVVESVSIQASGQFTQVVIQSDQPLKYRDIAQPDGIYIYMTGPTLCRRQPIERGYGDMVEEVRYGYQGAKTPGQEPLPLDYILLKLKEPASHSVSQRDWVLVVELKPRGGAAAVWEPVSGGGEDDGLPLPSAGKKNVRAVLPKDPTLQDFLQTGLANHVPLRLADEEYRLSRLRVVEAARAMFPSATGRYELAEGTLLKDPDDFSDDVKFERKEIGIQFGQPLFHSGRLYYGLRQAGMQKRASAQNVKKVRAEMVFEITRAYHNLVKSQRVVKARRELMERAEKVIELARKKRQLDLITESELLGAESQYSQAYYRLLSDEKDLEIARLRLEALMNLPEPLPETFPEPPALDPKGLVDLNASVEALVDQAWRRRPEMLSADYTARMNDYAAKAARAEGRLRVDASGFVGEAGGAFVGVPNQDEIKLKRSWNAGVQASLYFLGNSVRGTGTKDRTSPDYGETTATETTARSANVGFLDGLKVIGDARQARVNRERAFYEREQTRRNIDVEVREAYYGIQKARIQIKGGQQELSYRQKELAIARQKERMNLIEPSQVMAAESAYGEAVNSYEEAAAFYQVSLSSLEKAVGVPLEQIPELR